MDRTSFSKLPSPKILIVDDNPQNLQVLGSLLREHNCAVEFAMNGETALGWLNTKQFDLILLDVNMPGMNGFEVCSKIRSDPSMNNIPVIFLTAAVERESILRGFELGAQDYITKPFDSRELLSRVKTHLDLKYSRDQLEVLNSSLEDIVKERTEKLIIANEQLEDLNLKLFDLDKAKTEFLRIISHEIRTPLNGIICSMELLKEYANSSEIIELLDVLNTSVRRLEQFSLNALLITRLKTKQIEIRKKTISLNRLFSELISEMENNLKLKNIRIDVKTGGDEHLIAGDTELLKKCLGNLLDNAIFYSPANSKVEINLSDKTEFVECEIKDSGPGFEKEKLEKIFDLFKTGGDVFDNRPGLGLPISKMILDAHKGVMEIGNNPVGGAFVKIMFAKEIRDLNEKAQEHNLTC